MQGLVSCRRCGYALSRTSTHSSARLIHYYRCIGSDGWRHLGGPRCTNRPVRQDLLDQIVWTEVIRLLEDPTLIQQELDRVNKKFARVEQVKSVRLIDQKLSAEDEELTATMKLKRKVVERKYAALIESMYSQK